MTVLDLPARYVPLHRAGRSAAARARRVRRLTWLALAVLVVDLLVVVRAVVAVPVRVDSSSMSPTLLAGDVVLVGSGVDPSEVRRGDLVTFPSPEGGGRALKRVVGLPGETLVVRDAVLHVDDVPVEEPYVDHAVIDAYYSRTFTVPPGSVFLLGDNRGNSVDSRDYGAVPAGELAGRVLVRLWPPVRVGGPQPSPPKE